MNSALISDLQQFVGQPGVELSEAAEHVRLLIWRSEFSISLVIPTSVLEFFVEVHDAEGECLIQDWLDYAGYDATPDAQLAEDMRAEVLTFVRRLLNRELRLEHGGRDLEWQTGNRWLQAVPFVPDAEQAAAADRSRSRSG